MSACSRCGEENDDRARFCWSCGASLEATVPALGEERKVVSVLFVDLVGFTARSDRRDPEDVRATLRVYHESLKREIERFGGTVEKFVGDAVMAVFGAPLAHEDDAERAVRAALRITEAIEELNDERPQLDLQIRGAVNTGEAVVALGARPEVGEGFVTGDVVNVASRLQGTAPVGGIVVGELTRRTTRGQIEYEALEPVTVKGKEEPIAIWKAVGARSRFGVDVEQRARVPLIGRDHELNLLKDLYGRVVRDEAVQLVTISGEPGVGKSRLLWEFQRYVDDLADLVYWRQGRCLPYGEGVTYWALGEALKAHAGILESDGPEEAAGKLASAVGEVVPDEGEREWIRSRVAPLVGVASEGGAEREESFTAWRTLFEAVASDRPLVLVFEDLHWADENMLAFVEHLVDWVSQASILVLCTARPELYERAPGWGGGKRNATTIGLAPLTPEETAMLLGRLLEQAVLPADTQATLLERAGGNPLYAEEFVRMLVDAGALVQRGRTWELVSDVAVSVPDTVQALIAARLDTLPPGRKALLHDAAVVGKVFWSGVLAEMGGLDEPVVRGGLHELGRKELVRSSKRSSVRDQTEYAFWHSLIRDVAYGQIPRSARAEKHLAAARWIEATAGQRVGDVAELLVHHYEQALELSRAAGGADVGELALSTGRVLVLAGERTQELDPARAELAFRRALELLPSGEPGRKTSWLGLFSVMQARAAFREIEELATEALGEFRGQGDRLGEGAALIALHRARYWQGNSAGAEAPLLESLSLLESEPPSLELVDAYASMTGRLMMGERSRECIGWATRTEQLARELDAGRELFRAIGFRGMSRLNLGDPGGIDDVQEAVRGFRELGLGSDTAVALINSGDAMWWMEGPARGLDVHREALAFAQRRGISMTANWIRGEMTWMLFDLGDWDELLRIADDVLANDDWGGQLPLIVSPMKARVLLVRGDPGSARPFLETLDRARAVGDPQLVVPGLTTAAMVEMEMGDAVAAVELIRERVELIATREGSWAVSHTEAARVLAEAGALDLLEELRRQDDHPLPRTRHSLRTSEAILAEARGRPEPALAAFAEAREGWAAFGHPFEVAHARMGAGRCLSAMGRAGEATAELRAARDGFSALGAGGLVRQADSLLAEAIALSS